MKNIMKKVLLVFCVLSLIFAIPLTSGAQYIDNIESKGLEIRTLVVPDAAIDYAKKR